MSKGGINMITVFDVATEEELKEMFGVTEDDISDEDIDELKQ
jgi:hypothetical protein